MNDILIFSQPQKLKDAIKFWVGVAYLNLIFSQPQKLKDDIKAAAALERSLSTDLEPSLLKLAAVQVTPKYMRH